MLIEPPFHSYIASPLSGRTQEEHLRFSHDAELTESILLECGLTAYNPGSDPRAMAQALFPDEAGYQYSREKLAEADLWLRNIVRANRIYDPPSLRRVIERLWFQICLDSWLLGPQAFHIYRQSVLSRLTPVRMARFFRRFGKRALTVR